MRLRASAAALPADGWALHIGTSFYPVSQALETLIFAMLLGLRHRSPP